MAIGVLIVFLMLNFTVLSVAGLEQTVSNKTASINNPPWLVLMTYKEYVKQGERVEFTCAGGDPDGDQVRIIFFWNDGTSSSETEWLDSHEATKMYHTFRKKTGDITIRVIVMDDRGATSDPYYFHIHVEKNSRLDNFLLEYQIMLYLIIVSNPKLL